MNLNAIDPTTLPIVPPMDLGEQGSATAGISRFPMRLRLTAGLFGAPRTEAQHIRWHEGVDLLARTIKNAQGQPQASQPPVPIFAASPGRVLRAETGPADPTRDRSVTIVHEYGFRYVTFYQHLTSVIVNTNDFVAAGQRIGDLARGDNEQHLHFEVRYVADSTSLSTNQTLAVDSTAALYQWENRLFKNSDDRINVGWCQITQLSEVVRGRLPFIDLTVMPLPAGVSGSLLVPLIDQSPRNLSQIETLKQVFFQGKQVFLTCRESMFFGGVVGPDRNALVIAEVFVKSQ